MGIKFEPINAIKSKADNIGMTLLIQLVVLFVLSGVTAGYAGVLAVGVVFGAALLLGLSAIAVILMLIYFALLFFGVVPPLPFF